jgi:hypothetical protein
MFWIKLWFFYQKVDIVITRIVIYFTLAAGVFFLVVFALGNHDLLNALRTNQ